MEAILVSLNIYFITIHSLERRFLNNNRKMAGLEIPVGHTFWNEVSFIIVILNQRVGEADPKRRRPSHKFPIDGLDIWKLFPVVKVRNATGANDRLDLQGLSLYLGLNHRELKKCDGQRYGLFKNENVSGACGYY